MTILRLVLAALLIYLPNQQLFKLEFTVKGLNVLNMLFLLAVALMVALRVRAPDPAPLRRAFFFFFAVLVWGFAAGLMHDPSEWVNDLTALKNSIFYMLLFFLFYHASQDERTIRFLFGVILLVTFVAAVQGLRQALDYGIVTYNETRRVSAPFGWHYTNANRAAIFFAIFIPLFAAVGLFYRGKILHRLVGLGSTALIAFVVFFTYSRQSYFILAALVLLVTLRRSVVLSGLIVAALMSFESWAPQTVVERIMMTTQVEDAITAPARSESGREPMYDQSTESRFEIWEGAAAMIGDRPWGVGLNHFKREIGAYAPVYANMDAHNFYVLITAEAGLLGPVATLVLLAGLLLLARRVERLDKRPESRMLGIGFGLSVLAVAMGNIYGSRFLDGDVMGNFWALAGLVARYYTLSAQAKRVAATEAVKAGELGAPAPAWQLPSSARTRARPAPDL